MPSGPKKRKAAKRKMESLGVTIATIQQGGSESGSEINSPMSPDVAQFDGEQGKDDGRELETGGTGADVVCEENDGEKLVVEEKKSITPEKSTVEEDKMDEVAPASTHDDASASDSTGSVPISQQEVVNAEQVEPEKEVVLLAQWDKEKLENTVPIVVEQPVPVSSEEKEAAAQVDVHVEKVEPLASEQSPIDNIQEVAENSGSGSPPYDEVEEKVDVVDSQQLSSHEKEDKDEALDSVKPPFGEKGEDNEASSSGEQPPVNHEEEKVVSLSDSKSAEQPAESHYEPVHTESRVIAAEVCPPPQAVTRASWLNCCGLFDAFVGSNA